MNTFTRALAGFALGIAALAASAHEFKLGAIRIGHPYARATLPGQPNGGAYLRLENAGPDDRLVAASAPVSPRVELHESTMEGDVMRMRQLEAIPVPSNRVVVLQPNGLHIMLLGLKEPLKKGATFPLTLRFEKAGEVTVEVHVEDLATDMKH